jgi:hypothetical protein
VHRSKSRPPMSEKGHSRRFGNVRDMSGLRAILDNAVMGSFELPQFAQLTSGSAYQINE